MRDHLISFARRSLRASVTWGFLSTGLRIASTAILLPMFTRLVPPEQLGMWYVFSSVMLFVITFDFGITTTSSRKIAGLNGLARPADAAAPGETLTEYLAHLRVVYWVLGITTFVILSAAGGWWVWQRSAGMEGIASVRHAWIWLCPAFFFAVVGNQGRALLYGANRLNVYYLVSSVAVCFQFGLCLSGLLLGLQIEALVMGTLALFVVQAIANPVGWRMIAGSARRPFPKPFRREIVFDLLRNSFGTFLNSFAAYLMLGATALVASKFVSLSETASLGLTLQMIVLWSQVSVLWIGVKHPLYVQMSREDMPGLHTLIIGRMRLVLLTFAVGLGGMLLIGNPVLDIVGARTHFLPNAQILGLAAFVLLYAHQSEFEMLGLCLGKNPFVVGLLVSAAAGLGLGCLLATKLGVWGIILGPLVAQLAFNNWWVVATGLKMIRLHPREYLRRLFLPFAPPGS